MIWKTKVVQSIDNTRQQGIKATRHKGSREKANPDSSSGQAVKRENDFIRADCEIGNIVTMPQCLTVNTIKSIAVDLKPVTWQLVIGDCISLAQLVPTLVGQ